VSALHEASGEGHLEIVQLLLGAGADVDLAEFDGDTALVNASEFGHAKVVELLLEYGADPRSMSSLGKLPIQHARGAGHRDVVGILRRAAKQSPRAGASSPSPPPSGSPPAIEIPSRAAKKYKPGYAHRVAAVIGINEYDSWPALLGATPDARRVAERLREMGFDTVLDLYDGDATRAEILHLLGTELPAVTEENDVVMIFFAGHGQTETLPGPAREKRGYIIPVDGDLENVFSTAIPMAKLREITNRLPAKHVYYAMDSCYSGLGFTRGLGLIRKSANNYIDKVTSLRSVQMVTAGGEGEEVLEREGRGIFTTHLLDALAGAADANEDGFVTANEIGTYVTPRVTNDTGARQTPQSGRLEGEGEIAFELPVR
jgi:hypothetical protein